MSWPIWLLLLRLAIVPFGVLFTVWLFAPDPEPPPRTGERRT